MNLTMLRLRALFGRSALSLDVFLLAVIVGALAVAVGYVIDQVVVRLGAPDELLLWWNDIVIGLFAFGVALAIGFLERRAQRKQRARFAIIREVNHHVGNALQVVRLHQSIEGDPEMTAQVDDAIDRIEWVLRDVLPQVNDPDPEPAPADGHSAWPRARSRDSSRAP